MTSIPFEVWVTSTPRSQKQYVANTIIIDKCMEKHAAICYKLCSYSCPRLIVD